MKPHFQHRRLKELQPGTRAYYVSKRGICTPITIVWQSFKKKETGIHYGHAFDWGARKFKWANYAKVFVEVGI